MKTLVLLLSVCCMSVVAKAQDCSAAFMQGYRSDTSVTVEEAKRIIATSFAAINSCHEKLLLRSGSLFGFSAEGDVVMAENFIEPLDVDTKLRLISKLKPGLKMTLQDMRYGQDNRQVPKVTLTVIKGASYMNSSR